MGRNRPAPAAQGQNAGRAAGFLNQLNRPLIFRNSDCGLAFLCPCRIASGTITRRRLQSLPPRLGPFLLGRSKPAGCVGGNRGPRITVSMANRCFWRRGRCRASVNARTAQSSQIQRRSSKMLRRARRRQLSFIFQRPPSLRSDIR
jgi:hypothetical protein